MRIAMLAAVLLCVAWGQAAWAQTAPPNAQEVKVMSFSRDDVLTGMTIIDGVTGAWAVYALASGRSSGLADGVTLIATTPAIVYGAAVLGQDSSDAAVWVATLAAGAIFTVAVIDVARLSAAPGDRVRTFSKNLIILPRVEPMPGEGATRVGLALAGTF